MRWLSANLRPLPSRWRLIGIFVLGFIHGSVYLLIVPPWQHYDEPSHFERAWLTAHFGNDRDKLYDQSMRLNVAASMIENDFFTDLDFKPNLLSGGDNPVWIGYSQLKDPPLYYQLVSIPLKILRETDVRFQLYVSRLISLLGYLATIGVAYVTISEFTEKGNPLRWLVPLALTLIPAFTDLMTALTNDVGAILAFSIFMYFGVRLIRRRFSFLDATFVIGLAGICLQTKLTVWIALPLAVVALGLALFQGNRKRLWFMIGFIALIFIGLSVSILELRDAANWYKNSALFNLDSSTRAKHVLSPAGNHALQIESNQNGNGDKVLFQPLSPEIGRNLAGTTVTLGGWIWADQEIEINLPYLWTDKNTSIRKGLVGTTPEFISLQVDIDPNTNWIHFVLNPSPSNNNKNNVYYDGLILVKGNWPESQIPVYENTKLQIGLWGDIPFSNLLQNPSAEEIWFTVNPSVNFEVRKVTPIDLNQIITTIQNPQTFGWVYRSTFKNLIQSFWARFGWNHVSLPNAWYWVLAVVSLAGLIAGVKYLSNIWGSKSSSWKYAFVWFCCSGLLIWLQAFTRPGFPFWGQPVFLPNARYIYPAILPTMLAIVAGWYLILKTLPRFGTLVGLVFLLALDLVSLTTIIRFYTPG